MTSYEVNTPRIVWDRVDNEVVALDCVAGVYFRLNHPASDVWQALDGGATVAQLHAAGVDPTDLEVFISEFAAAGVLRKCVGASRPAPKLGLASGPLTIERFEDLTGILAADPIHEVDPDKGWPFSG